jgi:WD40 repeat protein
MMREIRFACAFLGIPLLIIVAILSLFVFLLQREITCDGAAFAKITYTENTPIVLDNLEQITPNNRLHVQQLAVMQGYEQPRWGEAKFSSDGKYLSIPGVYSFSISGNRTTCNNTWFWQVEGRSVPHIISPSPSDSGLWPMGFSSDAKILYTFEWDYQNDIKRNIAVGLWDVNGRTKFAEIPEEVLPIQGYSKTFDFTPAGKTLVYVRKRAIHLWDIETRHESGVFHENKPVVWRFEFSPDSTLLVAINKKLKGEQTANIWDLVSRQHLLEFHNESINLVEINQDNTELLFVSDHNQVHRLNIETGAEQVFMSLPSGDNWEILGISPNLDLAVMSDGTYVHLGDITTGKMQYLDLKTQGKLYSVIFNQGGELLVITVNHGDIFSSQPESEVFVFGIPKSS